MKLLMNLKFVEAVLGQEVADKAISLPGMGFSLIITEEQAELLIAKYVESAFFHLPSEVPRALVLIEDINCVEKTE